MTSDATDFYRRGMRCLTSVLVATALLLACARPATAQKDKKKKKTSDAPTDTGKPMIPMGDQQQIDYMISDMLGAWQVGDIEKLHRDYADDVSVVSGTWTPPVIGWAGYLAVYQPQRARLQQVRMDRMNTYIRVMGNVAMACYQWDFAASVDGQPSTAQGQTTLVLEKRNDRWVIVHNHTSLTPSAPTQANPLAKPVSAPSTGAQPDSQTQATKPPAG